MSTLELDNSVQSDISSPEEAPTWESFVVDGQLDVSYTFEYLPLRSLTVDYHEDVFTGNGNRGEMTLLGYQRKQDKIVKRMVKDGIKPDLFGALIVNRRHDGICAVADGGSRFRALVELRVPGDTLIPCLVFDWDSMKEIRNYIDLNAERSGLTQVDLFVAKVKAREEMAMAIDDLLKRETGHGVGNRTGSWQCVRALELAHRRGTLYRVLIMLRQLGWLDAKGGKTQYTVGALDKLLKLGADPDRCLKAWSNADLTPASVMEAAKEQKDMAGGSRSVARLVALVLGNHYNKGLRDSRKRIELIGLSPKLDVDDDDE